MIFCFMFSLAAYGHVGAEALLLLFRCLHCLSVLLKNGVDVSSDGFLRERNWSTVERARAPSSAEWFGIRSIWDIGIPSIYRQTAIEQGGSQQGGGGRMSVTSHWK